MKKKTDGDGDPPMPARRDPFPTFHKTPKHKKPAAFTAGSNV